MFIFLRLVLAHFVADFILQPDEVYIRKKSGIHGARIHYFIIFATLTFFSMPYLKYPAIWLVIMIASFTHIVQDEIKLRYITSKKLNCFVFILDQIIHIVFLAPIFIFPFAEDSLHATNIFIVIYNNDSLIIFCIGYIVAIFMGAYLWEALKISYFKNQVLSNPAFIKYGMFERFVITTAFVNNIYIFFLVFPILFRLISKELRFSSDMVFNLFYASAIGLILRNFSPVF
ncbi:MAG: DUF3307 domain-containing protein [Candidatus Omnitrophota bacterium]